MSACVRACVRGRAGPGGAGGAGLVRLWDARAGEQVGVLKGHTDNIRCLVLSDDGTRCLSGRPRPPPPPPSPLLTPSLTRSQ